MECSDNVGNENDEDCDYHTIDDDEDFISDENWVPVE